MTKVYADWHTLQFAKKGLPIYDGQFDSDLYMLFVGFHEDDKNVALFYNPDDSETGFYELERKDFNENSYYVEETSRLIPLFTAERQDEYDENYTFILVNWPDRGWYITAGCRTMEAKSTLAAALNAAKEYWCDVHATEIDEYDNESEIAKEVRKVLLEPNSANARRIMLNRATRRLIDNLGKQAGYEKPVVAKAAKKAKKAKKARKTRRKR